MEGQASEYLIPVIRLDKKAFYTENFYIGENDPKDVQ